LRVIDLGGQIVIAQNYLFLKMTRPPYKLWESGFLEFLSSPKGRFFRRVPPNHNYVLTLGSMGDDMPPVGFQELLCCFSALLLGYGVIYLKLKDRKKNNIYNHRRAMCRLREKYF
jgi:hypothetical protein